MLEHYTLRDCLQSLFQEYPRSYINVNVVVLDRQLSRSFCVEIPEGWGYSSFLQILPRYHASVLDVPAHVEYEEVFDLAYGSHPIALVFLSYEHDPALMVMHP